MFLFKTYYFYIYLLTFYSITRDNARNNITFLESFKRNYFNSTYKDFNNDIRCISYIINLIVQDILKQYILTLNEAEDLFDYITNSFNNCENN
jgi:hypothetical protein